MSVYLEEVPVTITISSLLGASEVRLALRLVSNDACYPNVKRGIKYGLRTRILQREAVSLLIRLGKLATRFRGEPKAP